MSDDSHFEFYDLWKTVPFTAWHTAEMDSAQKVNIETTNEILFLKNAYRSLSRALIHFFLPDYIVFQLLQLVLHRVKYCSVELRRISVAKRGPVLLLRRHYAVTRILANENGTQLSLKAVLPLAERIETASDHCSKTGPRVHLISPWHP